jgi:hypothetical protein
MCGILEVAPKPFVVATKKFRIKRSNGEVVKGKVDRAQSGRSVNLHVDPIHQFCNGTSLGQTLEAIKAIAFSIAVTRSATDAVDGFTMECGDSVTFE